MVEPSIIESRRRPGFTPRATKSWTDRAGVFRAAG
jgi:hypothetical protein